MSIRLANDPIQGQVIVGGVKVAIEWPKGSVRTYEGDNDYETEMEASYGYIRNTEGEDGEEIDAYVGPRLGDKQVFRIKQLDKDSGEFDEFKYMLGFEDAKEAEAVFKSHMSNDHFGGIEEVPHDLFVQSLPPSAVVKEETKEAAMDDMEHPQIYVVIRDQYNLEQALNLVEKATGQNRDRFRVDGYERILTFDEDKSPGALDALSGVTTDEHIEWFATGSDLDYAIRVHKGEESWDKVVDPQDAPVPPPANPTGVEYDEPDVDCPIIKTMEKIAQDNGISVALPSHLRQEMLYFPETGHGYQKVMLTLADGTSAAGILLNGSTILMDHPVKSTDIMKVQPMMNVLLSDHDPKTITAVLHRKGQETLKVVALNGSLQKGSEFSNTQELLEQVIDNMQDVDAEIIRLADYKILDGNEEDMGEGDEWPGIQEKILAADIVIFGTPVWWGARSSLIQKVLERIDALDDLYLETNENAFFGKVAGVVITGHEDGAMSIFSNLIGPLSWFGFTIPPESGAWWIGEVGEHEEDDDVLRRKNKATESMAKNMAKSLEATARIIKGKAKLFGPEPGQAPTTETTKSVREKIGMKTQADKVVAFVANVPGHKDSSGESAPWVIKDHDGGKILQSFKSKTDAEKGLQNMHVHGSRRQAEDKKEDDPRHPDTVKDDARVSEGKDVKPSDDDKVREAFKKAFAAQKRKGDKLDNDIEQAWYQFAFGVQVDIMDLGNIFKDVRADHEAGLSLEEGVKKAVQKYRQASRRQAQGIEVGDRVKMFDGSKTGTISKVMGGPSPYDHDAYLVDWDGESEEDKPYSPYSPERYYEGDIVKISSRRQAIEMDEEAPKEGDPDEEDFKMGGMSIGHIEAIKDIDMIMEDIVIKKGSKGRLVDDPLSAVMARNEGAIRVAFDINGRQIEVLAEVGKDIKIIRTKMAAKQESKKVQAEGMEVTVLPEYDDVGNATGKFSILYEGALDADDLTREEAEAYIREGGDDPQGSNVEWRDF